MTLPIRRLLTLTRGDTERDFDRWRLVLTNFLDFLVLRRKLFDARVRVRFNVRLSARSRFIDFINLLLSTRAFDFSILYIILEHLLLEGFLAVFEEHRLRHRLVRGERFECEHVFLHLLLREFLDLPAGHNLRGILFNFCKIISWV